MTRQRDEIRSPAEAPTVDAQAEALERARSARESASASFDSFDSFDAILKKVVATGTEDLVVGSKLVGRFTITSVLGEGGMGTVYVARDATLGRDVAIKVHHSAGGAVRLRREAIAMAKLAHPNVVTVFEVGDLAGRPFVVMEYVTGTTLRAWLAGSPRTVREILAMVIAAGEGLAAAHDAGLIHRDVKPENVLIGSDGRARVGDFGLARELDSKDEASIGAAQPLAIEPVHKLLTPMTQTGAVLGTPAYMSPEQFAGAPVDPRADQFAFCVTVWEALWKERPFAGTSFEQLHAAIATGTLRAAPATPNVPAPIRRALERGLSADPADRFPTMHALLDAMREALRRRRRRWLVGSAGGIAALAMASAFVLSRGGGGDQVSCDSAGAQEVAELRSDLPARLRVVARSQADRGEPILAAYTAGFRKQMQAACEVGRRNGWSPEIIAKSKACFAITSKTAASSLASADLTKPNDALHRFRKLPSPDQCANPIFLAARRAVPSDPKQLAALIEAHAQLDLAYAAIDSHDYAPIQSALDKLVASPAHDDPDIAGGMIMLRGLLAFQAGHVGDARKLVTDAYYAARATDDEQLASAALQYLIQDAAELELDRATVQQWLRTALADADRFHTRSKWLAGRVYTTAARAADHAGDAETSLMFVARAKQVMDPGDPFLIQTYVVEGAVKMWSGHVEEGKQAYDAAIAAQSARLGPDDPEVASILSDYAASLLEVEHVPEALAAAVRATKIIEGAGALIDPADDRIDPLRVNLGAVLASADHDDEARALLETARSNLVKRYGEHTTQISNIDSNLSSILLRKGEYDHAVKLLEAALATNEQLLGPDHVEVAQVLYNLAAARRYKHDYPAAIAAARRASKIYAKLSPGSDRHRSSLVMGANAANDAADHAQALELTRAALAFEKPPEDPQTLAWAQLEHARALIGVRRGSEARPFIDAARTVYTRLGMTARVTQIDALAKLLPR